MLILVTGGAGFLGSHLVDRLLARGDEVLIADDLSSGSLRNIDYAMRSGRATFVHVDLTFPFSDIREPICKAAGSTKIDQIFHLASPATPEAYSARPWQALCVNAIGTMAMIDLALEQRSRLIYASTSEISGDQLARPQLDSYVDHVDPIGQRACHDGKRFGEAAIAVAAARRGLDGRIVRLLNCYGPRMCDADGGFIAALSAAVMSGSSLLIHGDGRQTRSMTFVDDAIRLLIMVANLEQFEPGAVDVGWNEGQTVLEIVETFARIADVPLISEHVPSRQVDPNRDRADLTQASMIGYTPQTTLHDGLSKTLAWMRENVGAYA